MLQPINPRVKLYRRKVKKLLSLTKIYDKTLGNINKGGFNMSIFGYRSIVSNKLILAFCSIFILFVFLSPEAKSQLGENNCQRYQLDIGGDFDVPNLENFDCEKPVSKGDPDTVTPQIKIVEPEQGEIINYEELPTNGSGIKLLSFKVVVTPEYTVDFNAASSAGTEYLFLPQEADRGHLHAYCSPAITVLKSGDEITGVNFVGNDNRADFVGAFCVFQDADVITPDYQVLNVDCPLTGIIQMDVDYVCKVDTTEHSHGPRAKHHPRDVPPGDQVTVKFGDCLSSMINAECSGLKGQDRKDCNAEQKAYCDSL